MKLIKRQIIQIRKDPNILLLNTNIKCTSFGADGAIADSDLCKMRNIDFELAFSAVAGSFIGGHFDLAENARGERDVVPIDSLRH